MLPIGHRAQQQLGARGVATCGPKGAASHATSLQLPALSRAVQPVGDCNPANKAAGVVDCWGRRYAYTPT